MKLLTCVVTHNRLDYTKRTLESYFDTVGHSAYLVVVDNLSTDGTREWLKENVAPRLHADVVLNNRNLFPGAATNLGWHRGLKKFNADLLHRSDNDIEYLPGWREAVGKAFASIPTLGQLGLLNMHEDHPDGPPLEKWESEGIELYVGPTGGNCVLPRKLWDDGVRWMPGAWRPGGRDEDTQMSMGIRLELGLVVGRLVETVANNMSYHRFDEHPDYYRQTAALRGLVAETSV